MAAQVQRLEAAAAGAAEQATAATAGAANGGAGWGARCSLCTTRACSVLWVFGPCEGAMCACGCGVQAALVRDVLGAPWQALSSSGSNVAAPVAEVHG